MFKGKKVLVFGLGLLGGGVATASWLLDRGAFVTVTDLKDETALAPSLAKLRAQVRTGARDGREYEDRQARLAFALGGHSEDLIRAHDIIMVNPDVPAASPYLQTARRLGKRVLNEAEVFYSLYRGTTVGVTGTRGKTTTVNWISHLLGGQKKAGIAGNATAHPFLAAVGKRIQPPRYVTELPSFLLEHFTKAPDIAVITNLYPDHLNRYDGIGGYARTKAAVFQRQTANGKLILNADDAWTSFFLKQKPQARVWLTASRPLTEGNGLYRDRGWLWLQKDGVAERVFELGDFESRRGAHQVLNLMQALLVAHLSGASWSQLAPRIKTLPDISFRQEVVHAGSHLTVINDTCATSPDGAIVALERWGGPNCILIAGGTDLPTRQAGLRSGRQAGGLEFGVWAEAVKEHITPKNTLFLEGTATIKMRRALKRAALGRRSYSTLRTCLQAALKRAGVYANAVVLFSPGAKSFGLFKNEYDRGQQFNSLVKELVRRGR